MYLSTETYRLSLRLFLLLLLLHLLCFQVITEAHIEASSFNTEPGYDIFKIGGIVEYSGTKGPSGIQVSAGTMLSFESDESTVATGFQICRVTNG